MYKGKISYPGARAKGSVRLLTPLTPRSRSFASPVTTPVYSTAVSEALRQPLGGKDLNNIDPHQLPTRIGGWHRVCRGGDTLHRHYSVDLSSESNPTTQVGTTKKRVVPGRRRKRVAEHRALSLQYQGCIGTLGRTPPVPAVLHCKYTVEPERFNPQRLIAGIYVWLFLMDSRIT
jgi:hypothetical protein